MKEMGVARKGRLEVLAARPSFAQPFISGGTSCSDPGLSERSSHSEQVKN